MAGRGSRGRGKMMVPPSVAAAFPFGARGPNTSNTTQTAPSAKFPPMALPQQAPLDYNFSILLQEAVNFEKEMKNSIYFLQIKESPPERYSDKYSKKVTNIKKIKQISTLAEFFPAELHSLLNEGQVHREFRGSVLSAAATVDLDKFEEMEKKDQKEQEKKEESSGEEDEELVYEDEEFEDETDYNQSYFDNGEEYGDYDDGEEGPVY